MALNTNLHGRLRNTSLPTTRGLLPLFEAVVNSIHGIEDRKLAPDAGQLEIEILRMPQGELAFGDDRKRPGRCRSTTLSGSAFLAEADRRGERELRNSSLTRLLATAHPSAHG